MHNFARREYYFSIFTFNSGNYVYVLKAHSLCGFILLTFARIIVLQRKSQTEIYDTIKIFPHVFSCLPPLHFLFAKSWLMYSSSAMSFRVSGLMVGGCHDVVVADKLNGFRRSRKEVSEISDTGQHYTNFKIENSLLPTEFVDSFVQKNSLFPNYPTVPTYDIREWVVNLHLQRCTIVEIGEYFSALFLEDHNEMGSFNFYLGMCDHRTLKTWQFCSPELAQQRSNECSLDFDRVPYSRVHRRFCDVHYIILTQHPCNCSTILERKLHKVHGFPTCFVDPLPDSLCGPLNVCGLNKCNASTILGRIHSVQCDPKCKGRQLFCEWPVGQPTASIPAVYSLWSDWHEMEKIEDRTMGTHTIYYEAKCVNKYTYKGGIDCLGPGTSCCPTDILQCECKTFVEDVTLKVKRWIIFPIEHCTETSKDYDFSDDIVKQDSKKNGKVPFVLSRRDSQFDEEEEDDDDADDIADEDITIEEETKNKNEAVVPNKAEDEDNDEKTADNNEDLPVTSENQTEIAKQQEKSIATKTQTQLMIHIEIMYFLLIEFIL